MPKRLRYARMGDVTTDDPLGAADTTMEVDADARFDDIDADNILPIVLDPEEANGAHEVVHATAYNSGSSPPTLTIERAREGTTARSHPTGTVWRHGPTLRDYPMPVEGALVRRTSDLSASSGTNALPWQEAVWDRWGIWSAGAPTRLTVPDGVQVVRLSFGIRVVHSSNATDVYTEVAKNGAALGGTLGTAIQSARASDFATQTITATSAPMIVEAGDYFELLYSLSSSTNRTIASDGRVWCMMEILQTWWPE